MRLLLVNWADNHDPAQRGGGVAVYQRALAAALAAKPGVQVATLATGLAHSLRPGRPPRVVALPQVAGVLRYQMVDSGVLAPAHADFANPAQIAHPPTEAAIADFLARTGPWDAVQFNTLEGVPARVLALAPRAVVMLHNYYPLCPQVNLWQSEVRACTDNRGGAACVRCLPALPNRAALRMAYAMEWQLGAAPGTALGDRLLRPAMGLAWRVLKRVRRRPGIAVPAAPPDVAAAFAARRAAMVGLINAHAHRVLCVSDRVRQIALGYGIDGRRLHTCYIGSSQAAAWARTTPRPAFLAPDGTLRLAYLGYMRADKGFPFLMQALAALPAPLAARLHLTVAARPGPPAMLAAMGTLAPRLASLTHRPGYSHADLDGLLAGVDLGVVPVLWEDNLPQVAIEMHARHIPLLVSDRGGARELGNCPDLVFRAGDAGDFARALGRVLDGTLSPEGALAQARPPRTMPDHVAELLGHYAGG